MSATLALLLARARDGAGRRTVVALAEVANGLAAPLRHGLTAPGALLGGGSAVYGVYAAAEGWVAVAALEPAFAARLGATLGIDPLDRAALTAALRARTADAWEAWAREHDLPLAAVREAP